MEINGRSAALLIGGIVAGVALAGALGGAIAGGPWSDFGGWMHGGGMGGHHAGMRADGCHHSCGGGGTTSAPPDDRTVVMEDSTFGPRTIEIRVGESVTWVNRDAYAHTVTSDDGDELDSGTIDGGESWTHTFTEPGTYRYHCEPHAARNADGTYRGMVGTVVVTA